MKIKNGTELVQILKMYSNNISPDEEDVERIYSIPGYYYYINLVKIRKKLFLQIITGKTTYYLEYNLSITSYENLAEDYGFVYSGDIETKHFVRGKEFKSETEISLFETLLNLNYTGNYYISLKYGLK